MNNSSCVLNEWCFNDQLFLSLGHCFAQPAHSKYVFEFIDQPSTSYMTVIYIINEKKKNICIAKKFEIKNKNFPFVFDNAVYG